MPKSTRICMVIAVALTWWLTRCAYERRLARMRRLTERRARVLLQALRDS